MVFFCQSLYNALELELVRRTIINSHTKTGCKRKLLLNGIIVVQIII